MTTPSDLESAFSEVSQALESRDPERAFTALTPHVTRLLEAGPKPATENPHDRKLALTWLTLLRVSPKREGLQADAQRIITRWSTDPEVVIAGCDALIRAAELSAPDEPLIAKGPAELAAFAAEHCLERISPSARKEAAVGGYLWMNRANALRLTHRHDDARFAYDAALATDPNNGEWWFNYGLLHKAANTFAEGLVAYQRAREILGERKGVLWNIAICATATGKGDIAADAMRKLGFPARVGKGAAATEGTPAADGVVTSDSHAAMGGMPFVEGLSPVQVRVAALGSGHGTEDARVDRAVFFELVWVSPISPCHGVVQSTTHRDAAIDYGDLVLWDGTPVGVGEHEGKPVPRFPLLSVLRQGDERRFRFVALEHDEGDVRAFAQDLPLDALMFLHRAKTEMLCARCASGDHMRKHEHTAPEPHRLVYGKLVVPGSSDLAAFRKAFDARVRAQSKVAVVVPGMLEVLGETEAAGKAHQLWRGLERKALKPSPGSPGVQS